MVGDGRAFAPVSFVMSLSCFPRHPGVGRDLVSLVVKQIDSGLNHPKMLSHFSGPDAPG